MNLVESFVIEGFWGSRTIKFNFHEDVNFIIGINGSGKTTAINLMVAALTANFRELDRLEFSKISIYLESQHTEERPWIKITKKIEEEMPFAPISYEIYNPLNMRPEKFSLDDYEEQIMLRRYSKHTMDKEFSLTRKGRGLASSLERLTNVSWLSVHRASNQQDEYESDHDGSESTIDRKLKELSNRLVRYFSTLEKRASEHIRDFQQEVFLSMIYHNNAEKIFSRQNKINIQDEKNALVGIFSQFDVPVIEFSERLDEHFKILMRAREKVAGTRPEQLNPKDLSVLIGNERIDHIVDVWNSTIGKRKKILEPIEIFLQIINSMMQRKTFTINLENELEVTTQSKKNLPLNMLSSGEKQLLIILGEALLQNNSHCIYIADEPELSLHVTWQETLVENLRRLNPQCQIIFATHSPDIVSIFHDKIFHMENII